MDEYMILAKKNTSDVRGLNVLITDYILSARRHGAKDLKRKGVGKLAQIIQVEPMSEDSILVNLVTETRTTINHFHYSEVALTMETRARLAIFPSSKPAELFGPSKLEYDLESCDKFFLKE
jgi:hypothetical protein